MASKWFLSPPVQSGTSETWRRTQTTDTTVTFHLDYTSYYRRLSELIPQIKRGEKLFMIGWIFDDEMAIIGSANYWDRSLISVDLKTRTVESELGVAIVGDGVARLRRDLWQRLAASVQSKIKFPDQSTDFFAELAVLLGRTRNEIVSPSGGLKVPGKDSLFDLIPRPSPPSVPNGR
jgi:hypothetical protein